MFKEMSRIYNDDCVMGMENLAERYGRFADVIVTSPPYANQRKNQYGGIGEEEYPAWTLKWMDSVRGILKPSGSVFINIRPHIKNGQISDYVLKTRLILRDNGWKECEELIWFKPDSPPLGSINRPRRAWESILWFSQGKPYVDVKRGGIESDRIGYENNKFEHGGNSHIHSGQSKAKAGKSRVKDYILAGTSRVEKGLSHPAMFPPEIPRYLIDLACPDNGIVVDPFMGSGTTARECVLKGCGFVGFETNSHYLKESEASVMSLISSLGKEHDYPDFVEINGESE